MILIGSYVKWIDPAIHDYDEKDREEQLNKIYKVVDFNGYFILIKSEEGNEVEVLEHELVEL